MEKLQKMVSEKPVVIFSKNSCCMSHTIKTLFYDFGVNPTIYELDEIGRGKVPAVFIGGQLVGGANQVMSLHLNRSLIPMLKRAGALWV
ncbi:PREDICTED: monothiol glutaredoxin-S4-like [Tarenaya hassleriana]|uniref:monothiol glutaredoxin-S4-like n=1 Tax=Tarenaya hassleriana TaxID=28532 RepID=UPI00053C0C4E|nr:PREDICTED: monothiol glutaredoxin-S4-like [Tarenaya hassleriana]